MPLHQKLTAVGAFLPATLSEEQLAILRVAEGRLRADPRFASLGLVGTDVRDLALETPDGAGFTLGERQARGGHRPAILHFFQGAWSPFCRADLEQWATVAPYARALGVTVLLASPQSGRRSAETARRLPLELEVACDPGCTAAARLGLSFLPPPTVRVVFEQLRHPLTNWNAQGAWSLPLPATLVVGADGTVVAAHAVPDCRRRMEPMDALQAAAGLMRESA